jgi:MIP family channel proteins
MSKEMLRRYGAECLGTFALVFFGCGARAMIGDTQDFAGILAVHMTFAFVIAAMIYTLSHISSAQFNPAITLGFAISRRFPWRCVLPFWLAQFIGAVLASSLHALLIPEKAATVHFGATTPKIDIIPALIIEVVLTFFLMLVSMASATDKRFKRAGSGLTIGFTILAAGLFANSLSGASMNPARSLGPSLLAGGNALSVVWIYLFAPAVGAILGALVYEVMRGSQENAKEVLEEPPLKKLEVVQIKKREEDAVTQG